MQLISDNFFRRAYFGFALVGVVTNKPLCIQALQFLTVLNVVGDNTNNGAKFTHPDYASLVDPLCFAKRVKKVRLQIKALFPRSEERVVERSNDRVS